MDEQTNPMPAPVVQTPAPLTPPVQPPAPVMPSAASKALWIGLAIVVVLAVGAYAWVKLYPSSPAYQTPTPSETPTASSDATSGWGTYTNVGYSYEFRYPANAKLTSINDFGSDAPLTNTSSLVNVRVGNSSDVIFSVAVSTGTLTADWIKELFGAGNPGSVNPVAVSVAGMSGYKLAKNTTYVSDRYFVQDGRVILTILVNGDTAGQMLPTFKLISAAIPTGWTTYTNTEFGFQLTFPTEWAGYTITRHATQRSDYPSGAYFDAQYQKEIGNVYLSFNLKDLNGNYSVFSINVFTKSFWATIQNEPLAMSGYLGENSGHVFTWSHAQDGPQDRNLFAIINQVPIIISSFRITP